MRDMIHKARSFLPSFAADLGTVASDRVRGMLQIVAEQKERRLREKLGMALSERSETGSVAGSRHSTPPSPTQPLCLQKLMDTFSATGGEVTSSLRLQRLEEQQRMAKEQERRVRVGMPPPPPRSPLAFAFQLTQGGNIGAQRSGSRRRMARPRAVGTGRRVPAACMTTLSLSARVRRPHLRSLAECVLWPDVVKCCRRLRLADAFGGICGFSGRGPAAG